MSDGEYSDTVTINVTVAPINDPPVIVSMPDPIVDPDTAYSYTLLAVDIEDDS